MNTIFNAFNNLKILIIGDVMIDSYVWGNVNRISPEAPVPIVNVRKREQRLGGAANVALNIKAMGATPILCSVVGDDKEGEDFNNLLKKRNITAEGIIKSNARITTIKHRILAGSQHILRIDAEDTKAISASDSEQLLAVVTKMLPQIDAIIFEDYDKGVLNKSLIQEVIALANAENIPTVVDPKKRNFLAYEGATLFKPNLKELSEGIGMEINNGNLEEVATAIAELHKKMPTKNTMVTLSEHGVFSTDFKNKYHQLAHKREIADVSGAGDTVVSVATLCLAMKLPINKIATIANLSGGLVCEHLGVVPINKEKLWKETERLLDF